MDCSFSLPKLELNYWVSYANRTGVHLTTGPVRLAAELRQTIEGESKVLFEPNRISSGQLQSFVMLPPCEPVRQPSGLVRRPIAIWSVVRLSASLHDSRIRLKHHANLPGQVVQMLLKSSTSMQVSFFEICECLVVKHISYFPFVKSLLFGYLFLLRLIATRAITTTVDVI